MIYKYDRQVIETLYNINPTEVLTGLIIDIKKGTEFPEDTINLILSDISRLKGSNKWSYETEEKVLDRYNKAIKRQDQLALLTPSDREKYYKALEKKLLEYDFSL